MQFEAKWENLHANLQDVGLGKTMLELYLAYLQKVGTEAAKEIRKDRRPRPDESGGTTTREAKTWQKAHAVVVELESIGSGPKALASHGRHRTGGQDWRQPAQP